VDTSRPSLRTKWTRRARPQLLPDIEPALSRLRTSQPLALAGWQLASLQASLKSTFLALLKLPACSAYAAVLVERLQALGAQTQAEAARRIMEKARLQAGKRMRAVGGRSADPRLAESAAKRARGPVPPLISPDRIPKDTPLEEWPAELVTLLVMEAMQNYPPALPPHLIAVQETPLGMWPERLAYPSTAADDKGSKDEGEGDDKGEEGAKTAASLRAKALNNAKPLKKEAVRALAADALARIMLAEGAGWDARAPVLARLVATSDAGVEVERALVDHVLTAYKERHELAMQYPPPLPTLPLFPSPPIPQEIWVPSDKCRTFLHRPPRRSPSGAPGRAQVPA